MDESALSLVMFRRGAFAFAVDVHCVRRVLRTPEIRPMMAAPVFVPGGVTVDGRLEVLVDLSLLFDLDASVEPAERVLLVRSRTGEFGLLADTVDELARTIDAETQPPPPFVGGAHRDAIRGTIARDRTEVLILDLDRLVPDDLLDAPAPGDSP